MPVSASLVSFCNSYMKNCRATEVIYYQKKKKRKKKKLCSAQGMPFENLCLFSRLGYIDPYALAVGIEMPGLIHFAIYKNREGK